MLFAKFWSCTVRPNFHLLPDVCSNPIANLNGGNVGILRIPCNPLLLLNSKPELQDSFLTLKLIQGTQLITLHWIAKVNYLHLFYLSGACYTVYTGQEIKGTLSISKNNSLPISRIKGKKFNIIKLRTPRHKHSYFALQHHCKSMLRILLVMQCRAIHS